MAHKMSRKIDALRLTVVKLLRFKDEEIIFLSTKKKGGEGRLASNIFNSNFHLQKSGETLEKSSRKESMSSLYDHQQTALQL